MLMKTHSRPRIGITPDIDDIASPETGYVLRRNYADAVARHGGLPLILPYTDDVSDCLRSIDGLLVTGGMFDIDPVLYRQTARKTLVMKPTRTRFEKALIDGALARRIPVLGICNGMQLLAVCLGGELVQDIMIEVTGALEHKPQQPADVAHHGIHSADVSEKLPGLGAGSPLVNSVHHQAVLPCAAYRTIAVADDGVIEAIEAIEHDFAVGVQWHPEYGLGAIDGAVMAGLIAAATTYVLRSAAVEHA
jgi:putative glutamine amidotransferase